jgi:hypothetical protein
MPPAGLPRIDPPAVATTSRDPARADAVGAVPATAPWTMTDTATTATAPIAPILNLRLAPDRLPVRLPDIRVSLLVGVRRGRNGNAGNLRPEKLRWRTFIILRCSAEGEHQSNDSMRCRITIPVPGLVQTVLQQSPIATSVVHKFRKASSNEKLP